MNRLEAIKAMLDGKKIGHLDINENSYYFLKDEQNPIAFYDGHRYHIAGMIRNDGYYIIKNKVKKYKVLYIMKREYDLLVSSEYYTSLEHFNSSNKQLKGIQILEATMIEVEE